MKESFYWACENLLGSSHIDTSVDPPVLIPPTEEQLRETVLLAANEKYKIHIVGGGTLPVSPLTGRMVTVSLAGLSAVTEINPADFVIIAQSGVIVDRAVEEAGKAKLLLPLDITSGSEATVGGAYMSGSIGLSSARYGSFRDAVIGVRCVSAEGKIIRFGGRTTKNVTGYDLTWFLGGTMGMYAIVTELTIKVRPLPETQIVSVSRYKQGLRPCKDIFSMLAGLQYLSSLELVAPAGLGGEITIGAGIEGMKKLAVKSAQKCKEIMESAVPVEYREESPGKSFRDFCRQVSHQLAGPGLYTLSVSPSASGIMLERLSAVSTNMPVIAHPLMGRFHVVCSDNRQISAIAKIVLALGGKHPVAWESVVSERITGLFTESELTVVLSLKRELDPECILNPHLIQT